MKSKQPLRIDVKIQLLELDYFFCRESSLITQSNQNKNCDLTAKKIQLLDFDYFPCEVSLVIKSIIQNKLYDLTEKSIF